jgi:hypothetical protein
MRRVDCRPRGAIVVEDVPWGDGKRTLTRAYMLFLARWARRLSWKETAEAFRTSWEKVFDAVEHVITWGLEHRVLGEIDAIGVDEIPNFMITLSRPLGFGENWPQGKQHPRRGRNSRSKSAAATSQIPNDRQS